MLHFFDEDPCPAGSGGDAPPPEPAFKGDTDLLPAVAQDADTGEILMLAWMNRAAYEETVATGRVVYWSRSRKQLWRKGDTSGHIQEVVELRLDCDSDAILIKVRQTGPACHTGCRSCFFRGVPLSAMRCENTDRA